MLEEYVLGFDSLDKIFGDFTGAGSTISFSIVWSSPRRISGAGSFAGRHLVKSLLKELLLDLLGEALSRSSLREPLLDLPDPRDECKEPTVDTSAKDALRMSCEKR